MDKAYRLGDRLFDSISINISVLDDITYYLDKHLGYCQSITGLPKFNFIAAVAIPEARECIKKKVMGATTEAVTEEVTEEVTEVVTHIVTEIICEEVTDEVSNV